MLRMLLAFALVFGVVATAGAGVNPEIAIALHVQQFSEECDSLFIPDCWAIQTQYPTTLVPIYVYVLICGHGWDGDGFVGASYGLTWPPEWGPALGWWSCSDIEVGEIMIPGDFVEQVWAVCQPPLGKPEVAGILQLLPVTPGEVKVTVHGITGTAAVLDCHGGEDIVLPCHVGNGRAGWVSVMGVDPGCNPCPCVGPPCYLPPSAAENDTWGGIKVLFR